MLHVPGAYALPGLRVTHRSSLQLLVFTAGKPLLVSRRLMTAQ